MQGTPSGALTCHAIWETCLKRAQVLQGYPVGWVRLEAEAPSWVSCSGAQCQISCFICCFAICRCPVKFLFVKKEKKRRRKKETKNPRELKLTLIFNLYRSYYKYISVSIKTVVVPTTYRKSNLMIAFAMWAVSLVSECKGH